MTIINVVFYFEALMVVTGSLIMNMRNTDRSLVEETGSTELNFGSLMECVRKSCKISL